MLVHELGLHRHYWPEEKTATSYPSTRQKLGDPAFQLLVYMLLGAAQKGQQTLQQCISLETFPLGEGLPRIMGFCQIELQHMTWHPHVTSILDVLGKHRTDTTASKNQKVTQVSTFYSFYHKPHHFPGTHNSSSMFVLRALKIKTRQLKLDYIGVCRPWNQS